MFHTGVDSAVGLEGLKPSDRYKSNGAPPTNLRKKNEGRRGWRRKKRRRAPPGLNLASATGSIAHVPFLYSVLKNHLKSNGFIFFIWINLGMPYTHVPHVP